MATARAVASGAAWNYAAQVATVLVQLAYAAVTARLLGPHDFGVYAAAFASVQLVNLVALAGLPQIVGRMTDLEPARLSGLLGYASAVGVLAAAITWWSAPGWAALWGVPEAADVLRVLAITSFVTPLVALGNGLALRLGLFRRLAMRTVAANVGGMALGVGVVVVARTTESLAVAQIAAQATVAALVLGACRRHFRARPAWRRTLADVRYSGMTLVSALLTYSAGTVGRVTVSQALGTVPLGNWNRADAITTNPFYALGAAITQAVFPEFRHDRTDRGRTARVWSDLLGVVGWVCVPLGAAVAVLAPVAVQLLLGDGWALAGGYAAVLAVIGGLQPVVFLLTSGFEALGRFAWNWAAYGIALVVNVASALVALAVRDVWPVFVGTLVSFALFHALHLVLAHREGLVEVRRVLRHYGGIAAFSTAVAAVLLVLLHLPDAIAASPLLPVAVLGGAVLALVVMASRPDRFPPVRLARDYGLLRRGGATVPNAVPEDVLAG